MIIYIGADHRGYELKNKIVSFLRGRGYQIEDLGFEEKNSDDDYPDIAAKVAKRVSLERENSKGIVLCGSGVGVDIVVNKFENIRSALLFDADQAFDSRNDDDANVASIPADYLSFEETQKILVTWLQTPFSKEPRHRRRLEKIQFIEQEVCKSIDKDTLISEE